MQLHEILFKSLNEHKHRAIDTSVIDFFSSEISIFVVGRNEVAESVCTKLEVKGIIDDFSILPAYWNGIPCCRIKDLPTKAVIINCSFSISPISVVANLKKEKPDAYIVAYFELAYLYPELFSLPHFVKETQELFKANKTVWNKLFEKLEDEESKSSLIKILLYRLTGDYNFMNGFSNQIERQYLEQFLNLRNERFVDIGGFVGDTTEVYCEYDKIYDKVFFCEPSTINMDKAKARLSRFERVVYFPTGISNVSGRLPFSDNNGSSSTISEYGDVFIEVDTLDNLINEPVTFMKIDIEGHEIQALEGAEQTIRVNKPKIAVAVYHKIDDFTAIFNYILGIHPDYKVYLRHYTEGWSETILFFTN